MHEHWQTLGETKHNSREAIQGYLATLRQFGDPIPEPTSLAGEVEITTFESSRFRQAVRQIVRLVKAERVGINMMDIAVCGAVAPYNSAGPPLSAGTVAPSIGSGQTQGFTFSYLDPIGYPDISGSQMLFNSTQSLVNGCYI